MNSEFGGLLNNLPKAPDAKPTASRQADSASSAAKKSDRPLGDKGFEGLLTDKAPEKTAAKGPVPNKNMQVATNPSAVNQPAANKPAPRTPPPSASAPRQIAEKTAPGKTDVSDEAGARESKAKVKATARPDEVAMVAGVAGQAASQPTGTNPQVIDVKALTAVLGRGESALRANPTLSFLAGKLENLSPEMIPSIVTDSKFITDALSQADIAGLMKQPVVLGDLLGDLGYGEESLGTLSDLGVNLGSQISPSKLLSALGVDPGSVGAELHMLKDNLQLEGLVPYLTRATRLQGPVAPELATNAKGMGRPPIASSMRQPISPQTLVTPADAFAPAVIPLSDDSSQDGQATLTGPTPINPYAGLANTNAAPTAPTLSTPKASAPTASTTAAPVDSSIGMKAVSTTPGAYQLQYQQFDERFNQLATDRVSFDKANAFPQTNVDLSAQAIKPEQISLTAVSDKPDLTATALQVPTDTSMNDPFNQSKVQTPNLNSSIERLVATQLAFGSKQSSQGDANGEGAPKDEFFSIDALGGDKSGADQAVVLGATTTNAFSDQLAQVKAEPMTATKASEHAKSIADLVNQKAQMLTSQGGGSVLLDLGTPETGKIEIALDVTNDKVGMKILTASEHVKNILMGDMPKLREALNAQSLDLKQVDFGFKRDFNSHQQHQHGQAFQQQQQFNEQQRQGFNYFASQKPAAFNFSRFQTPINQIGPAAMSMPVHSGNIQVRV